MGQPHRRAAKIRVFWPFLAACACVLTACDAKPSAGPATRPVGITVASLVPAATDLILAMGAGDRLVAVSNYDTIETTSRPLPRVGDYQTTDWETLASLHPKVMLIEIDQGRLPPGFGQRAVSLGMKLVNVKLQTITDIADVSRQLGRELGDATKGDELAASISRRIDAVRRATAGKPPVRTLLAMDERGEHLVGVGEFLNDALVAAGGVNAAESLHAPYPSADPETLAKLKPDVVIVLKPGGTEETLDRAKQFWSQLGGSSPPRVYLINDRAVLRPGSHVADTAEAMAKDLHP